MMKFESVENWALHAFADGELHGAEKAEIENLLKESEEARHLLTAIRQQKAKLHEAYDPALTEQVPNSLISAAKASPRQSWFSSVSRMGIAASIASAIIGGSIGWFARSTNAETLADRAANKFTVYAMDVKHPVEVGATEKDHLQAWLSKRIGVKFSVPDLSSKGFSLMGGRLLSDGPHPAGLLVYEDASKKRMSIYLAANPNKNVEPLQIESRGKLNTCHWVEKDMVYALAGEQPQDEMLGLAQAAHEGFDQEG